MATPIEKEMGSRSPSGKAWNMKNLGLRAGADVTSATAASILVAPLICVIDRAIVTKASFNKAMWPSLLEAAKPALRPHKFLVSKPFLLIFSLYFSTYMTANTLDTITSTIQSRPARTVSSTTSKFLATSSVNMTICVYKDTQFAQMFGKPGGPIPMLSRVLFAARDGLTIFASFNLPSIIAPKLTELPEPVQQRFKRILATESGRMNTAQFMTPAAMQIFSTPVHLLGLDLINRQGNLKMSERVARVTRDWGVSALARMGRIVPAFGVGGVFNARVRKGMMVELE